MSRSALVTGGTGGIGTAIVRRLRANGYEVVFCGRDEHRAAALERATGAVFCPADATDRAACDASVAFALERLGRIDLFVANARPGPARDDGRGGSSLLETNLTRPSRCRARPARPMRHRYGAWLAMIASGSVVAARTAFRRTRW